MASIKLARLPDRNPVKVTLHLPPDLARALDDYAAHYERTYSVSEPVSELIPAILRIFLDSDRSFTKGRKI